MLINPDVVEKKDRNIPNRPPLDLSIYYSPKNCKKCNNPLIPLHQLDPKFLDCCFYCGFGSPIQEMQIVNDRGIMFKFENYSLPPPPELIEDTDSVRIQMDGIMTISKIDGTYCESFIKEGYQIGHKFGISLKTKHEAALLKLLSMQSKEFRAIKDTSPKNEYIVKNQYEIVVECKQIEAFEEGKIKENPKNPNTMTNAFEKALDQHSHSQYNHLPLLIHFWIKYQDRLPLLNSQEVLQDLIDALPKNTYFIASIGLLTDLNYCDIYYHPNGHRFIMANQIIETIEALINI